jgi:RNA polymerase sigma-70 factor (ECF subfamily)
MKSTKHLMPRIGRLRMTESNGHPDEGWLQAIVQEYESQIVRYAARLLGDQDRARDVAQDTFLQLCCQPRASVEQSVRSWLFTVCRNRAMDVRKKESRMKTVPETDQLPRDCQDGDPSLVAERRETFGKAATILNTLPDNQQEVIRLKVQNGLSYREISDVTGLSVSNVGFLLHKGIKRIREEMGKDDD